MPSDRMKSNWFSPEYPGCEENESFSPMISCCVKLEKTARSTPSSLSVPLLGKDTRVNVSSAAALSGSVADKCDEVSVIVWPGGTAALRLTRVGAWLMATVRPRKCSDVRVSF